MNINSFSSLNLEERATYIWYCGTLLDSREEENLLISLFSIDTFYVEIYFEMETIKRIVPINNTEQLLPYLDKIETDMFLK